MQHYGFIKTALGIPFSNPGDLHTNTEKIIALSIEAFNNGSSIILFPELSITGYTCQDLFSNSIIIQKTIESIITIKNKTKFTDIIITVGAPLIWNNGLYNCAVVIQSGKILGIVPKIFLAQYREFYEARWFKSGLGIKNQHIPIDGEMICFGTETLFRNSKNPAMVIGIEICEDVWTSSPPSGTLAENGATIILNLSASNIIIGKDLYRRKLIEMQSARLIAAYLYCNTSAAESTTDLVFDGDGLIYENGILLSQSERFLRKDQLLYADIDLELLTHERTKITSFPSSSDNFNSIDFSQQRKTFELTRLYAKHPFVPANNDLLHNRCKEIFTIQATGLAKRLETTQCKAVIGLSGGLDSTLALLVTIKAMKLLNKNPQTEIIPITMPGFGTTTMTRNAVEKLCDELAIPLLQYPIHDISNTMFDTIEHPRDTHDITYENIQARSRTYILMSIANKHNGIVIGTGDLSELALGWSTYNGDHISMYNVNSSIPKTLVKYLINEISQTEFDGHAREILSDILTFPISPELLPTSGNTVVQKTEDVIGPYELHDFFLYYFVRWGFTPEKIKCITNKTFSDIYSEDEISQWLTVFIKRFFTSQWKRDCVPAGPKVGSIDLSPRGSWRMSAEMSINDFLF
ncbi:MAG: NAD(+) synthase [Spirochaetes bacterium GWF1_31_7]|nr:MAG: NAD(+) synthase [Spirochaetes bacterium GWE1_32_154]OHD48434.1 MAG: NAD(+) synthase [Spirochaetes bacterium GWE2_31_10]OHD50911.1 MAG: NAD(+) synthase [Spirochaetes bacterium GWF1_31_7]OHD73351.1 MAG: NAD(+) synthase [Spirochaetes bacterium RIFOXYB1_FULL_32_8]